MGLGLHIDSGEPVDPVDGASFATTPDGVELVRRSAAGWAAAGWADAAIADGDDAEAARAAATRTVDFYTVEPDPSADA